MAAKLVKTKEPAKNSRPKITLAEFPETGEVELQKQATEKSPARKIKFPKKVSEQYKLPPEEFAEVQEAVEAFRREEREVVVFANSIECSVGYDSLIRVLGNYFGRQMAYFRSAEGGALPAEEARKRAYQSNYDEVLAADMLQDLLIKPSDTIGFDDLIAVHRNDPVIAENLWEAIKREAQREFESGHRAASAFEPADYMKDAWNRASYLGLRESLCEEWKPKGGIELSMIDAIAQAWLQMQFWTEESVRRSRTQPREENPAFQKWKRWNKQADQKQWDEGCWDIPTVNEQAAIEHAAQMADRWQRMYFRAIRNLRDWRRYAPQLTINNPNQVNIAADGGQQVNISRTDEQK